MKLAWLSARFLEADPSGQKRPIVIHMGGEAYSEFLNILDPERKQDVTGWRSVDFMGAAVLVDYALPLRKVRFFLITDVELPEDET